MSEQSLKESLEAAFDGDTESVDRGAVEEAAGVVEETVAENEGSTEETETASAGESLPDEGDTSTVDSGAEEESREGDEGAGAEGRAEGEEEPEKEEKAELAAPYGWKPAMREKYWGELPDEVKAEVIRREVDIAKGMEIAKGARDLEKEFNSRVAPYAAEIASRGVQPMDAFENYLATAHNLRHANAPEKAALIAGIIQQYGVDVEQLDGILTKQIQGAPASGEGNPDVVAAINKALAPVNQFMSSYQNQQVTQAETQQTTINDEIAAFKGKPENEFYMDVKEDMANLLEAAAMRSQNMTLQEAYDRAILLHSDIAQIVSERRLQSEARKKDEAAKAAKAKSVGVVSTSPDPGREATKSTSLRGALEASFDANAMD
jgi:hypothetical protein